MSTERWENTGGRQEPQEPQELMINTSQVSEFFHGGITRIMSWCFEKEDENKKEELIRSTESLHQYVHKYFNVTNRLLKVINTHMEQNVSPAVLANENESIQQNCDRVRKVMFQIYNACEKEHKHVQKMTDPVLYEKIATVVSLKDKITAIKELHNNAMGNLGNFLGPLVTIQLVRSDLMNLMPSEEDLKSQPISSFILGDLVKSSKKISKRLCGSPNQQKTLDEVVQCLQDLLSILRPLCDSYSDTLTDVEAYVTILSKKI